jgi:hypothetical protein
MYSPEDGASRLLKRLKSFLLPGGEDAARSIDRIRLIENGEIRSGPQARWTTFTAEEIMDSTKSAFAWEADLRTSKLMTVHVTDAYEGGHGWARAKVAGVTVKTGKGPDYDRGEIQRYLASLLPPAFVNHPHLAWAATGPNLLQVRDVTDPTGSTVDYEIDDEGKPAAMRAQRPMTVGKEIVYTAWTALGKDYFEWNGMRFPKQREAIWHLPEGAYTYYRGAVTEISAF